MKGLKYGLLAAAVLSIISMAPVAAHPGNGGGLIHDGVLIEARNEEEIEHAKELMRAAGREVCGGFEIGVDVDQRLEHGVRYRGGGR